VRFTDNYTAMKKQIKQHEDGEDGPIPLPIPQELEMRRCRLEAKANIYGALRGLLTKLSNLPETTILSRQVSQVKNWFDK
jgi:hypothetical protein